MATRPSLHAWQHDAEHVGRVQLEPFDDFSEDESGDGAEKDDANADQNGGSRRLQVELSLEAKSVNLLMAI